MIITSAITVTAATMAITTATTTMATTVKMARIATTTTTATTVIVATTGTYNNYVRGNSHDSYKGENQSRLTHRLQQYNGHNSYCLFIVISESNT